MPRRLLHAGITRLTASSFTGKELQSLSEVGEPLKGHTSELVKEVGSGRRLLVVMVGWSQSSNKSLAKYASLYNQLGLPCVTMATHMSLLCYTSLANRNTKQMVQHLDKSTTTSFRVLYHIFSSGGYIIFPHLMAEYDNPSSPLRTKFIPAGVVLDSGPINFSAQAGYQANKSMYDQGGYNYLIYTLVNGYSLFTDMAVGSRKRSELQAALKHTELLQMPQLYLYSENDLTCSAERVRGIMEGQRKMGRQVTGHCWTESEHVKHYVRHPEEYKQKIADFIAAL